jgi:hypothetical protein
MEIVDLRPVSCLSLGRGIAYEAETWENGINLLNGSSIINSSRTMSDGSSKSRDYMKSSKPVDWSTISRMLSEVSLTLSKLDGTKADEVDVFQPLFEVTKDPSSHPELHVFLQRVVGFVSVDDESKPERRLYRKFPTARMWDTKQSPPYSYWYVFVLIGCPADSLGSTTCTPIWRA